MTRKKPLLIWDDWNREHIKNHSVTIEEVEEVYAHPLVSFEARRDRQELIAKVKNGRMIAIILSYEKQEGPYVVSARDAGYAERRIVYETTKTN